MSFATKIDVTSIFLKRFTEFAGYAAYRDLQIAGVPNLIALDGLRLVGATIDGAYILNGAIEFRAILVGGFNIEHPINERRCRAEAVHARRSVHATLYSVSSPNAAPYRGWSRRKVSGLIPLATAMW